MRLKFIFGITYFIKIKLYLCHVKQSNSRAMKQIKTVNQAAKLVGKTLRFAGQAEWIERMRKQDAEHPENTIGWVAVEYKVNGLRVEEDGKITLLVLEREVAARRRVDTMWKVREMQDVTKYEVID